MFARPMVCSRQRVYSWAPLRALISHGRSISNWRRPPSAPITVTDPDGEPVPEAYVVIEGEACLVQAKTMAEGTARVLLPANDKLRSVEAWHPKLGGAGNRDVKQDLTEDAFRLSLLRSTPHVIRIVDVEGRPIRALPFMAAPVTLIDGGFPLAISMPQNS